MEGYDGSIFTYLFNPSLSTRHAWTIQNFFDHIGCHWVVHRPKEEMFYKKALVISQSAGAPNNRTFKSFKTILSWTGLSYIKGLGFKLPYPWEEMEEKKKEEIKIKIQSKLDEVREAQASRNIKNRLLFQLGKSVQSHLLKIQDPDKRMRDLEYWLEKGWIKENK